jgi:hypothetical protein
MVATWAVAACWSWLTWRVLSAGGQGELLLTVTVPIIGTMYKAIPDAKDAPRL